MIQTDMSALLPDEENRLESGTPESEEQPEKRTSLEVRNFNIVYFSGGVYQISHHLQHFIRFSCN